MKYTVKIEPTGFSCSVNPGTPLRDIIHESGIEFPCAGQGICGKCKFRLLEGNIALTGFHRKALERNRLGEEWRLACLSRVTEDITIRIDQYEHIILADSTPFRFTPEEGYGIAVDLGSTTIVSQLLNLGTGEIAGVETGINPQARFGADIISRISYALESEGNAQQLRTLVRNFIGEQVGKLSRQHQTEIKKVNIVGNTVMHHLFCGQDVAPLSVYPFVSSRNEEFIFHPQELNWSLPPDTLIRFLPNIGSFVGSDILAGIKATGMHRKEKYQLLIDLGTNGELAIGNRDGILCASTAAGPAFEGTNISQGMRATTGAISGVSVQEGVLVPEVIGREKAQGICGSGLIDAITAFLETEQIDFTGNICSERETLPLTDSVSLSAQDIREFQLAKAAIAAGVQLLINQLGITRNDVEHIYIAGGFGNYIDLGHATSLGLLEFESDRIIRLSNSALIGAKMSLFTSENDLPGILALTSHLSLETAPGFQDVYCEKMFFDAYA